MDKTLNFATNYTLTIAKNSIVEKIEKETGKIFCEAIKNYSWEYFWELKIWKGHNIVPLILRNSLAQLISWNSVTPSFKANYLALWTDSTNPADSDTILWAEFLRGQFGSRYAIDNVAFLDKTFSTYEVSWKQINEIWIFVDWNSEKNTWYLLSRIVTNQTLWDLETLTVNSTITIV